MEPKMIRRVSLEKTRDLHSMGEQALVKVEFERECVLNVAIRTDDFMRYAPTAPGEAERYAECQARDAASRIVNVFRGELEEKLMRLHKVVREGECGTLERR